MLSYTSLIDEVEVVLQDSTNATWGATGYTTELPQAVKRALVRVAKYKAHVVRVPIAVETRTGTASSTSTSHLVDATNAQFLSTDVGKIVYNSTDKTRAVITAYTSTSDVTLSRDIMASGENYNLYNEGCINEFQINLSDVTDYIKVDRIEYPLGSPRNFEIDGDILTIGIDSMPYDTADDDVEKHAYVWFAKRHKLSQLTDLIGAVDLPAGYSEGDTSMVIDGLQSSGTIEADQEFTISGLPQVYTVTADATITTNEATVTFYPGLEADIDNDTVVTFTSSTLDWQTEPVVINLSAGEAALNKSVNIIKWVNGASTELAKVTDEVAQAIADLDSGRATIGEVGTETSQYLQYAREGLANANGFMNNAASFIRQGSSTGRALESWGQNKMALAERELQGMCSGSKYKLYPRS